MASRLKELRVAAGLSQQQLAGRVGTSRSQIVKLERGERRMTEGWMRRLATALGCRPEAFLGSAGGGGPAAVSAAGAEQVVEVAGDAYAVIPVVEARLAAGAAGESSDEVLHRLLFRMQWLRAVTQAPIDRLAVAEVDNDSMETTLRPGDHVLVDLGQCDPRQKDGIYVLRRHDGLQVKRVWASWTNGLYTIKSDNPAYATETDIDPALVEVVGRVVWLGRRV